MSYADADVVRAAAEKMEVKGTVNEDELAEAIQTADDIINSQLTETAVPSDTPSEIVRAANLFAKAAYLDSIGKHRENRSPTAVAWDDKAWVILNGYKSANSGTKQNSPYRVYRSPRDSMVQRGHSTPESEDRRFRRVLDGDGW